MKPSSQLQAEQRAHLEKATHKRRAQLEAQAEKDPSFMPIGYSHDGEMKQAFEDILVEETQTQ